MRQMNSLEKVCNPWKFGDKNLEALYHHFLHRGLLSRFAEISHFVLPLAWITEIAVVAIRFYESHLWTPDEAISLLTKLSQLILGSYIACFERYWSERARSIGSSIALWCCRSFYIVCFVYELGVHQHPAQALVAQLWLPVSGAIVSPSFFEYVIISVILAFTRPICYCILGRSCLLGNNADCPNRTQLWNLTLERLAINVIAGSMVYHIHADRRKAWLLTTG